MSVLNKDGLAMLDVRHGTTVVNGRLLQAVGISEGLIAVSILEKSTSKTSARSGVLQDALNALHHHLGVSPTDCLLIEHPETAARAAEAIFRGSSRPPKLYPLGTPFQKRVWTASSSVPRGITTTYGELAQMAGLPANAARAVANAVAANRIAGLIPCHRVVRADASQTKFRWGNNVRLALLGMEQHDLTALQRQTASTRH